MNRKEHWISVHRAKTPESVSWHRPHLEVSLALIRTSDLATSGAIVDVGGGASTLVDDLLEAGYSRLAVLDVFNEALALAQTRQMERQV